MGYNDYSNIENGYQNGALANHAKNEGNLVPDSTPDFEVPQFGKKGEFVETKVYSNGVGNYHINHFIGYFESNNPASMNAIKNMNKFFFEKFYNIFNRHNVAKVDFSDYKYLDKQTLMFTGVKNAKIFSIYNHPILNLITPQPLIIYPNISAIAATLGGLFHKDWVSIEMMDDGFSFYGSTLKRKWAEDLELNVIKNLAAKLYSNELLDKITTIKFAINLVEVNQHHFLAGRRSWAVGFNNNTKKWYVETMAFERSSQCEYNMLEKSGMMREQIIKIWTNLIFNFTKYLENFDLLPLNKANTPYEFNEGYTFTKQNVAYKVAESKEASTLFQKPWISKALKRHPGLTKGL